MITGAEGGSAATAAGTDAGGGGRVAEAGAGDGRVAGEGRVAAGAGDGRYALPDLPTLMPPVAQASSLAEKAYYLIRDRIIRLELAPGAIVNERGLMAELGLGRTPIREALHRLADDRLVDIVPRRGVFVTPIDIRDLGSISEVRVKLEGYAGRLAAERATAAQREEAGSLLDQLEARHLHAGQTELIALDQLVHRHVHACTHNAYLRATLEEYFVLSLRLWFLVLERIERLDQAVTQHRDLLVAIRDADAEAAEQVLVRHIRDFEEEIRRAL